MLSSSLDVSVLLLLTISYILFAQSAWASRVFPREGASPLLSTTSKSSPSSLTTQSHNVSQTFQLSKTFTPQSGSQTNTITAAPSQTNTRFLLGNNTCTLLYDEDCQTRVHTCVLGNQACKSPGITKTVAMPFDVDFQSFFDHECVLWDPQNETCQVTEEERKEAIYVFFHLTQFDLQANQCNQNYTLEGCSDFETPERMSQFQDIKNWMRQSDCLSSSTEYAAIAGLPVATNVPGNGVSCCDRCLIFAENVDIFYWPDPNADTSCMDIVGDEIFAAGDDPTAKKDDDGRVYWDCTIPNHSGTDSIITTAEIGTSFFGTIPWKTYWYNPWDPSPCTDDSVISSVNNLVAPPQMQVTRKAQGAQASVTAHYPLIANGSKASTVIVDGNTL